MRGARDLFRRLVSPEHLEAALASTVRGKRRRPDVAWMLFRRDEVVARLAAELAAGTWQPAPFALLPIRDPKPRLIARAPVEDRVVHAAVARLMEPSLLRRLRPEAVACRPGFGAHRGLLDLLRSMRRHAFVVHLDIRAYFPSVDLEILSKLLARRFPDRRFLAVLARILESGRGLYDDTSARALAALAPDWPPPGRGLPIGAFTSQVLASHLYLDDLDHHIKRQLRVPGYLRYVDDLFLFGDARGTMRAWREEVGAWLVRERHVRLKHPQARVLSTRGHLDALGHRITREGIRALPRALRRFGRKVVREAQRPVAAPVSEGFRRSVAGTAGVVLF